MTNEEAIKELDSLKTYFHAQKFALIGEERFEALDLAIKALEKQSKTGRWIWKSGKMIDYCSCSVCKKGQWEIEWNYCPNCGAKMTESEVDVQ